MGRKIRAVLGGLVVILLVAKWYDVAALFLFGWGLGELFLLARKAGRKGYLAFAALMVLTLSLVGYEAYYWWTQHALAAQIEGLGAKMASVSGKYLPGPVDYVVLGEHVGDAELARIVALEGLDHLESVIAEDTPITDDGLLLLTRLPRLRWIYIGGKAHVTPAGVAEFKQQLPDCQVLYFPPQDAPTPSGAKPSGGQ